MEIDTVCFSPLRWEESIQRPQQLLGRCAREGRVFYVEEPVYQPGPPRMMVKKVEHDAIWKVVPTLPKHLSPREQASKLRSLIDQLLATWSIQRYTLWYYHPAALEFTRHLDPILTIYDCMTRLTPADGPLFIDEQELLNLADLVISDGQRTCAHPLFKSSQGLFPGSIDADHFFRARAALPEPTDQAGIPHPRLGFLGVINHLFDWRLLEAVAAERPHWHFILLGPITVEPGSLLNRPNVHYLCTRAYDLLPAYLSGWDAALLPLTRLEPGTHLAAAQVPQYLAGGCPVVTTRAPRILSGFAGLQLVDQGAPPHRFIRAVEKALRVKRDKPGWLDQVDQHLAEGAWNLAWEWVKQSIILKTARTRDSLAALVQPPGMGSYSRQSYFHS